MTVRELRHDLRSPLMVIGGLAGLLGAEEPVGDAERRDYARRIAQAAAQVQRLVDDALGERS